MKLPSHDEILALYNQNRFLDAYRLTEAAWDRPEVADTLDARETLLAGRLARRLGSGKFARGLFKRARELAPEHPAVRFYTRDLLHPRTSILDLLEAFEAEPVPESADDNLRSVWAATHAISLSSVRDFERARERIALARDSDPDEPWVDACEAGVLYDQDRWAEALAAAEHAWDRCPGLPYGSAVLGFSLAALGRPAEAASRLLRWSAASPQSWEVLELGLRFATDALERGDESVLEHLPGGLYESTGRVLELAPLADRRLEIRVACLRADAAKREGRREELLRHARTARTYFFNRVAENLRDNAGGKRSVIEHERVRQRHNTCLPASVVTCASAFGEAVDHDRLVERMTYDGTPTWRIVEWAEENDWSARPFLAQPEACFRLVEAGFPFVLTLRRFGWAHAVAAVGVDAGMRTLIYHEPSHGRLGEILIDQIGEGEAPLGPECLAVAPPDAAGRLAEIELPGEDFARAQVGMHRALQTQSLASALEIASEFARGHDDSPQARFLAARAAHESGDPRRAVDLLRELLGEHPDSLPIQQLLLASCQATGDTAAYRDVLGAIVLRQPIPGIDGSREWIHPEPVLLARYADLLSQSATRLEDALRLLRRALYHGPYHGESYHYLADILWNAGGSTPGRVPAADTGPLRPPGGNGASTGDLRERSLLAYRIASCLDGENEHYADAYAWALRKRGRAEEGIAWLRRRAERFTGDAGGGAAWATLVTAQEAFGFPDESLASLEEALRRRPADVTLAGFAVSFLSRYGRFDDARRALETCRVEGRPTDYHRAAAILARREGDRQRALEHARAWLEERPLDRDARRAVVELVTLEDGVDAAGALVEEWFERHVGDEGVEEILLEHLDRVGDDTRRIALLERRVERNPLDDWALRELSWTVLRDVQTLPPDALVDGLARLRSLVDRCVLASPGHASTTGLLAELATLDGDTHAAVELLGEALLESPDYVYAINRIFDLVRDHSLEEKERGVEIINRAFSTEAGDLQAARTAALGIAEYLGKDRALEAIERWSEISPDDPVVAEAWADVHVEYGFGREAAEAITPRLERMVARYPLHSGLALSLADAYTMLDRHEDAVRTYTSLLERDPGWTQVRTRLADALAVVGRPDEALAQLRQAVKLRPRDHSLWLRLADAHVVREDRERAVAVLAEATGVLPSVMDLWERRIEILESLGRPQEAIEVARELNRLYSDGAYTFYVLARTYRDSDLTIDRAQIETAFQESLRRNARLWAAVWDYSIYLCDQGDHERAARLVRDYLELEHDDIYARGALCVITRLSGDQSGALEQMLHLVEEHPGYEYGWRCVLDWIEEDRAWETGRKVLASAPPEVRHHIQNGCLLLRVLRFCGEAPATLRERWSELVRNYSTSPRINLTCFDELWELGEHEGAERVLADFARYEPDSPPVIARQARVASRRGDRDAVLALAREVFDYQGRDMPNSAALAFSAVEDAGLLDEAVRIVIELLDQGVRVMPACIGELADRLGAARVYTSLIQLLDALQRCPGEWDRGAYLERIASRFVEVGGARLIVRRARRNELDTSDTRIWQVVGRALAVLGKPRKVVKWMRSWRERDGVEQWALSNYAWACLVTGRRRECVDVSLHSLEHCQQDHAAPDMVTSCLRAQLELGDVEAYLDVYSRFSALRERSEPVQARVAFELLAELMRETDHARLREIDRGLRDLGAPCAWAIGPARKLLARKMPFWWRLLRVIK